MRWIVHIGLLLCLCSCGSRIYSYKFSMKESDTPDRLHYENDTLSLKFKFYLKGLMISFANKSGVPVTVNWEEVKVAENGTDRKIAHIKIMDEKISVKKPPSVFPPGSVYNDFVVYAANLYYPDEYSTEKPRIKDMYPRVGKNQDRNAILNLKGQRITLHFPVEINNGSHTWVFNFSIDDIISRKKPAGFSAGAAFADGAVDAIGMILTSITDF